VEFINGEKHFQSPARMQHIETAGNIYLLLKAFCSKYDLGFVGYEKVLISLSRNDYGPDICFFNKEISRDFQPKKMQFPAPNLVVEVLSDSTEERDRGIKYEDYALHGIMEYWIVDSEKQVLNSIF
jgi:Uma2 family endonuclease